LRDIGFFKILLAVDRGISDRAKQNGCRHCGGILDVADYPRKPRGIEDQGQSLRRLSFCCRREGCRKRTTPESLRFLGRKVYTGVVVVLGVFDTALIAPLNLCRQTLSRWASYWGQVFHFDNPFWKIKKALLPLGFDAAGTTSAIVQLFESRVSSVEEAAKLWLEFFSPLTLPRWK